MCFIRLTQRNIILIYRLADIEYMSDAVADQVSFAVFKINSSVAVCYRTQVDVFSNKGERYTLYSWHKKLPDIISDKGHLPLAKFFCQQES